MSYVSSAQWGYAAAASTIQLNRLVYDRAASLDPGLPQNADLDHASSALVARIQQEHQHQDPRALAARPRHLAG